VYEKSLKADSFLRAETKAWIRVEATLGVAPHSLMLVQVVRRMAHCSGGEKVVEGGRGEDMNLNFLR